MAVTEKQHNLVELEKIEAISPAGSHNELEAVTGINEKSLLRKLDFKLLPALTLLYLLSFLDRSNVGNARLEGLTTDLHMTGNQYLTGLTLYFIGYFLFEIPANIVLKLTSPRVWLPTLTLVWGVVATLMGVTKNLTGFYVARFALGVAESGLFPGVVFYLSMWYRRSEQHYRIALFFSAASLAGAFGGVFAWKVAPALLKLPMLHLLIVQQGYCPYEGLISYAFINNYPATAKFLSKDERSFIQARLASNNDATRIERFTWGNVLSAIRDPKVWLYGFGFHTLSLPLYTLSLFLPTIIKELGFSAAEAQLLTVPPYVFATCLTVIVAVASEKTNYRAPFIMGSSCLAIIGYIILLSDTRSGVSYVGTIFAAGGIYPATAIVLSWPANNVSGQTKRATANAMQISIGNLGAVLGTQLYRTESKPRFFVGHGFALGYLVANVFVVGTLWWVLKSENARRDRGGRQENLGGIAEGEWLGDEDPRWRFQT